MTPEEARKAWAEAQEATQEQREVVSRLSEELRQAQRSLELLFDRERRPWVEVRDTEWQAADVHERLAGKCALEQN